MLLVTFLGKEDNFVVEYTIVNPDSWNRKSTFEFFNKMSYPYLTISAKVDISKAFNYAKKSNVSLYGTISWLILKAMNQIEEFKYRYEANNLQLYKEIGASFSVLKEDNALNFSRFTCYNNDYTEFLEEFNLNKKNAEKGIEIHNTEKNIIYLTCLPLIEITQMTNPMDLHRKDSIPRIGWGKVLNEKSKSYITLNIQVHHGLIDGYHVGKLCNLIEKESDFLGEK